MVDIWISTCFIVGALIQTVVFSFILTDRYINLPGVVADKYSYMKYLRTFYQFPDRGLGSSLSISSFSNSHSKEQTV